MDVLGCRRGSEFLSCHTDNLKVTSSHPSSQQLINPGNPHAILIHWTPLDTFGHLWTPLIFCKSSPAGRPGHALIIGGALQTLGALIRCLQPATPQSAYLVSWRRV